MQKKAAHPQAACVDMPKRPAKMKTESQKCGFKNGVPIDKMIGLQDS
jgi:hypothetical protein